MRFSGGKILVLLFISQENGAKGMDTSVSWQKQDLNDYEPARVDFNGRVIVTELSRLVVKSMRSLLKLKNEGRTKTSVFRLPKGRYYLAHTDGMSGWSCARVCYWLSRGGTNPTDGELSELWGELSHYVVKNELFEAYCVEAQMGFYEYEVSRWERKYSESGVVEYKGAGHVLCPAFPSDGTLWAEVKSPERSIHLMPNSEGEVGARFL